MTVIREGVLILANQSLLVIQYPGQYPGQGVLFSSQSASSLTTYYDSDK